MICTQVFQALHPPAIGAAGVGVAVADKSHVKAVAPIQTAPPLNGAGFVQVRLVIPTP